MLPLTFRLGIAYLLVISNCFYIYFCLFLVDVLGHGVTVQVSVADNLLGNDGQQDDSELSAVQRHRKKKKAAELDLGINLEQINHNLKLAESKNEIIKSNLSIMNEICGIDSNEFNNNKWMTGNQNELNKKYLKDEKKSMQ